MPPPSRDEINRRLRSARRRPAPSGVPASPAEVADAERGILRRQAEAANVAALPQPKEPSNPS